ncbi:glycoside hydrolase family 3 N-terminal domain-containing protein [Maricaulis sp.]|uniref:glycoside hydrolase family 3 N-terminal domain-containing protein n=1 Tax=Maricaulis sp. TaxID=1486257 RepID=UPI001B01D401|nr:glycoside hydrolase family 3 N-terminal domain-containing protein [Maricaulis sp.]MBO6798519.1 glycoside hydrolase family 3 C-terminal domain-containing protein [Maricaulis sp.]
MSSARDMNSLGKAQDVETRIGSLLEVMSIEEKVGQLNQVQCTGPNVVEDLAHGIRSGRVGSVINVVDPDAINAMQHIAIHESRHGIPLLIGRDVIHGFKTVAPLPLGQAASWNPGLVRECARVSAQEATAYGINWTFAPMIDIARDPRWGRVAESLGEDPFLASALGAAMVVGFQESANGEADTLIACAKHFAGYGASEAGRDYNTTNLPLNEMRNVYLPPFKAAREAGVATFMTSFSDIDGIPATASDFLLDEVLRQEWGFDGAVVSDWDAIHQLCVHGLCENDVEATYLAARAGVDIDMISGVYERHIPELVASERLPMERLDTLVGNVLRVKIQAGLMDRDVTVLPEEPARMSGLALVREAAAQSLVLLRNENAVLPLEATRLDRLAVIGPLADEPAEQLGTWVFDGDPARSVTPLAALHAMLEGEVEIDHVRALETTRSRDRSQFDAAFAAAQSADMAIFFIGEEAILSGEAHSRADITLPGVQADLVRHVRGAGKPVIGVILAGRPLAMGDIADQFDALIYAWHPGSMGGPAIADTLFGRCVPSGKLPVSFPTMSGQVPIYYAHKQTGRPATPETVIHIDDIPSGAEQTSLGMTTFHLDAGYLPLYPFGFGLSYTTFDYADLSIDRHHVPLGGRVVVEASITNTGDRAGTEIVQLYVRDRFGSLTRPVRELKGFERIHLEPGQSHRVRFELHTDELAFYGRDGAFAAEPGDFDVWVAPSSVGGLHTHFAITA